MMRQFIMYDSFGSLKLLEKLFVQDQRLETLKIGEKNKSTKNYLPIEIKRLINSYL